MPFQKDFYKEHPNVTARSIVSVLVGRVVVCGVWKLCELKLLS